MTDGVHATTALPQLRQSLIANAAVTVMLTAFATEAPLITAGALLFLAVTLVQAGMWLHRDRDDGARRFWTFAVPVPVYALTAGAVFALVAVWEPAPPPEEFYPLDAEVIGVLGVLHLAWVGTLWRRVAIGWTFSNLFQRVGWWRAPEVCALLVQETVAALALLIIAAALVLTHEFDISAVEAVGACVIGFALTALSIGSVSAVRDLIAGAPVSQTTLRSLTAAVDRATMQSGAVRQVLAIDALHTESGKVLVMLQLAFKDGVSAQHITPVLDKLRTAVQAELPSVADVVLFPPPAV